MMVRRIHLRERGAILARAASGAFTLLEVVVASAMFATVIAAVVTTFFAASHLRQRNEEALDRAQQVHQALSFLKRDFRSITIPATNSVSSGMSFESGGGGEDEPLTLSGEMTTGVGLSTQDGSQFQFSTASGVLSDGEPWGPVQRVRYYLREPLDYWATNGLELVRGVTRNVLTERATPDYTEQLLLPGVRELQFFFWNGTSWLAYWDSTKLDPSVPEAIRVLIEMMPRENDPVGDYVELVVPISVRALTNTLGELPAAPESGGGA